MNPHNVEIRILGVERASDPVEDEFILYNVYAWLCNVHVSNLTGEDIYKNTLYLLTL